MSFLGGQGLWSDPIPGMFKCVPYLTSLESLSTNVALPATQIALLTGLTNLSFLEVTSSTVDPFLENLKSLTKLETLLLPRAPVSKEGLLLISQNFTNLRILDLNACRGFQREDLNILSGLQYLDCQAWETAYNGRFSRAPDEPRDEPPPG